MQPPIKINMITSLIQHIHLNLLGTTNKVPVYHYFFLAQLSQIHKMKQKQSTKALYLKFLLAPAVEYSSLEPSIEQ
eukprot:scaffold12772_cov69-Cylindrotheca_fusiformis.AAC.1